MDRLEEVSKDWIYTRLYSISACSSNTNQTETGAVETLPPARTVGATGAAGVVGHSLIEGTQ